MFNALIGQESVVVSDIPHTTREPFDTEVMFEGTPFVFIDTAGIRRKALIKRGIEFEDINVAENKEALKEMVEKSGQMGVPVVDIDGQIVVGFDQERLSELLNIN